MSKQSERLLRRLGDFLAPSLNFRRISPVVPAVEKIATVRVPNQLIAFSSLSNPINDERLEALQPIDGYYEIVNLRVLRARRFVFGNQKFRRADDSAALFE